MASSASIRDSTGGISLKKRVAILILSLCVLKASLPAMAQTAPSATAAPEAGTQKAHALLDKMIAAMGGQAFLNYATLTEQGRVYTFYQGRPNGTGVEFWYFWQYPDKDRTEIGKKRDVVRVHGGDQGYEITYKGTAALDEKEMQGYLRSRAHSMNTVLRRWLKDPDTLLLYAGTGIADNRMIEQITVVNAKNESVTIAVDPTTYLPIKKSFTYHDPIDNLKSEETETYGNYRLEQGMMTAHSIVSGKNGDMVAQRFLTRVEYNPQLKASLFDATVTYDPAAQKGKR
jgi:hypothetical protein